MLNSKLLFSVGHSSLSECLAEEKNVYDIDEYVMNIKRKGDQMILSGQTKKCALDGNDFAQKFLNEEGKKNLNNILHAIFKEYFAPNGGKGVIYFHDFNKKRIYFFPA